MSPSAPLLAPKLRRPAPPQKCVPRAAILRQLNAGLALGRAVTLVSAPAGFGKTTAVSEWLACVEHPIAWLSLDMDDNDPVRFFTYLIAALGSAVELDTLREVEAVLRSGQLPPLERLANALILDLASVGEGRLLLVLDDFHLLHDPFILKVIERLMVGLFQAASQPAHLVLLTREDPALPLARLRAAGLLTEIRAADLRFQPEEAGQFLNSVLDLALPQAEIDALEQKTEGWAAGLQLAGLSLRGHPDPARFIAGLSGAHRYILGYLTEEVLSRQPEEIQRFLLSTAILDRLSADLCRAVTGRSDSAMLLELLWSANLFLVPLDDEQHWYRYHHLFADLLRSRQSLLHGDETAELHRRAGQWYARSAAGLLPAEQAAPLNAAVRHLLAAEDYSEAVRLIEAHAMDLLNQWYAKSVIGWLQAVPPEWLEQRPKLNLIYARARMSLGEAAQAVPVIARLQKMLGADGGALSPEIAADWLTMQSTLLSGQGQPEQALALARRAQTVAPEDNATTLCQVYLALALAYQQVDDLPHAEEAYRRLITLGEQTGSLVMELLGRSALALMLIQRGRLREGHVLALAGIQQAERMGVMPPICAGLFGELGQAHFHWLDLEQAGEYLRRAAQVSELSGFSDTGIFYAVFRARQSLLRGDPVGAEAELLQAAALMREDAPVVVREELLAQQMIVALARGDLHSAEQIFAQTCGPLDAFVPGETAAYQQGVLYNCALRILLYRARQQRRQADAARQGIRLADQLLEAYRRKQYVPHILEALLLRAQLYQAAGDSRSAQADLTAALDLAGPEIYLAPFALEGEPLARSLVELLPRLDPGSGRAGFAMRILAAANAHGAQTTPHLAQPGLPEPLTGREIEVLRFLAEGQTYEQIAAGLVVSINTVRSHVKAIYGKLGVGSRTAAIELARRENIL